MSDAPLKISIVITCFNYARYVAQAIDGALNQTYPHKEVIVVDDGSTDGSTDIIARYGERIKFIAQQNQGQAAAGYAGFKVSSGDIILFLDADDVLMPAAAAEVVRAWQPSCAKVQYDLSIVDSAGEELGRQFCHFLPSYNADVVRKEFRDLGIYLSPVMSGNAFARGYLEQILPLTTTRVLDGILNTVAPVNGYDVTIPKALACYRINENNYDKQAAAAAADPQRFVKSIRRRYDEIDSLREHAARQKVSLPAGNFLDNDLVFINYRLMLKKIGYDYMGAESDTPFLLWQRAMNVLGSRPMSAKAKVAHGLWFSMLLLTPGFLAVKLILLRFNRAAYIQPCAAQRELPGNNYACQHHHQ